MGKPRAGQRWTSPKFYGALAGLLVAVLLIPYGRLSICERGHGPGPSPGGCSLHVKSVVVRYPDDQTALWALVAIASALLVAFVTYRVLDLRPKQGGVV